jgi:hypothetical protein
MVSEVEIRATDTRLDRAVAIKVIPHRFSTRFEREARPIRTTESFVVLFDSMGEAQESDRHWSAWSRPFWLVQFWRPDQDRQNLLATKLCLT